MTSISTVAGPPTPVAIANSTTIASIAAPKLIPAPTSAGPAATIDLSQKGLAMVKGDRDWKPGQKIDSY